METSIVPYLNNEDIANKASLFRSKFWNDIIPINIEAIIDIKLAIDVIPVQGFFKDSGTDALITSNWKSIYVDREEYLDERRHNRLRFSLAHEIGHFILHKKTYTNFKIKTRKNYYELNKKMTTKEYGYLETQANKFANYLLVPRKILIIEREKELKRKGSPAWFKKIDPKTLNSYLAIPLSKVFNVSDNVITIALNDLIIDDPIKDLGRMSKNEQDYYKNL